MATKLRDVLVPDFVDTNKREIGEKEEELMPLFHEKNISINTDLNISIVEMDSLKHQVRIIYMIALSSGFALNAQISLLPAMCRDQFLVPEDEIGVTAGNIQGLYSLCQSISGVFFGHLTDKMGRRPTLLLGMVVGGIGTLSFGFAESSTEALIIRGITGFFNNSISTGKTVLADLTLNTPAEFRQTTFAYFGAVFSASRALVTALTSFTSQYQPNKDIPYFFPLLVASIPIFCTSLFAFLYLPESVKQKDYSSSPPASPSKHKDNSNEGFMSFFLGLRRIFSDKLMIQVQLLFCLNQYCNSCILLGLSLVLSTSLEKGGFALNAQNISLVFTFFGIFGLVFQFSLYKRLLARYGMLNLYKYFGCYSLSFGSLLFAISPLFLSIDSQIGQAVSFSLLFLSSILMAGGFMMLIPNCNTFITNVADPTCYGLTQGTSESLGKLCRAVGPSSFGILFTLSVSSLGASSLPFFFLSFLYFITGVLSNRLPTSITEKRR